MPDMINQPGYMAWGEDEKDEYWEEKNQKKEDMRLPGPGALVDKLPEGKRQLYNLLKKRGFF